MLLFWSVIQSTYNSCIICIYSYRLNTLQSVSCDDVSPAYGSLHNNVKMQSCPAYEIAHHDVKMQSCPAYEIVHHDVKMQSCPAYDTIKNYGAQVNM